MLEPDPTSYYYKEFGKFGALKIDPNADADSVWKTFCEDPGESPCDVLAIAVNRFVVVSPSLQWAVWGSREEELVIFGVSRAELLQGISYGHCDPGDLDAALSTYLTYLRRSDEFNDLMTQNYGSSGTPSGRGL